MTLKSVVSHHTVASLKRTGIQSTNALNKHSLRAYYIPGTILDAHYTAVNKINKIPAHIRFKIRMLLKLQPYCFQVV